MEQAEMRARVEAARVGRLATVDAQGAPHVVPVCFALVGDAFTFAVDHKPKRGTALRRMANLAATGRASLLVDDYDEDWSRLWWVRLDGRGVVAAAVAARAQVDALVAKYPQYAERRPVGPVAVVRVERWSGWSAYPVSPPGP
jgi:PPOX class probable F420-dependent enzyme